MPTHDSRSAISRARFFLERAQALPADARIEFEAFLEAAIVFARTSVHRVQHKYKSHAEWGDWWDSIEADPAVKLFRIERNQILKEAPPRIGQKAFLPFIGPGGVTEPGYAPARADEFYFLEDPAIPATVTVGKHLDALATLLSEAERRFGK